MQIKEKVIRLLDKIGGVRDINPNQFYHAQEYQEAIQLAQRYQNIAGVTEQMRELQVNHETYRKNLYAILNEVYDQWNQRYHTWRRTDTAKNLSKNLAIGAFVLAGIGLVLTIGYDFVPSSAENILDIIVGICLGIMFPLALVLCVVRLILGIAEKVTYRLYKYTEETVSENAEQLTERFLQTVHHNSKNIDNIYLASLSPEHREIVLMRRDQERQHQENMRQQRQQQEAIRAEQERTRIAQEALLRIEQEREERYRRA